ncbi:MAG: AMP-binding protein, partial [Hyphomonadaceae bacterium]
MHPVHHAAQTPDKLAVIMAGSGKSLSYSALNSRSNQVAHLLRSHGLGAGDAIAVLLDNCPDYFEIAWGAQRAGLYFTCLSTKLQVEEIAYILTDSNAKVLFVGANLLALAEEALTHAGVRIPVLVVGGDPLGHKAYSEARDTQPVNPIADESSGADMLYSSGTTGRPKGIKIPLTGAPIDTPNALQ